MKFKEELYVDIDYAIEMYNLINKESISNGDLNKMDRYLLAEELGVNKQLFTELSKGRVPKSIKIINHLVEMAQRPISEIVKPKL